MAADRPKCGFVGAGRVATALAVGLSRAGYPVVACSSRSPASARGLADRVPGCALVPDGTAVAQAADVVFITTPDDAIEPTCSEIRWRVEKAAVHCSGSLPVSVLSAAADAGALVGGLHPIQTFAGREGGAEKLAGTWFGVEADDPALRRTLEEMVATLGGQAIALRGEDKPLYHLGAVLACNYMVTLASMATEAWGTFGVAPEATLAALQSLMRGTLDNLAAVGLPDALTGPIARGDVGTVESHLAAMEEHLPHFVPAYRELARRTIPIGLDKGTLASGAAQSLRQSLSIPEED